MSLINTSSITRSSRATYVRSNSPLSLDVLREKVPSVFADSKHESRSARYEYIPTSTIIERLGAEGFYPYAAAQSGAKDAENGNFTKHMVRFRHASSAWVALVGDTFPEVVLVNSHNGSSSFQVDAGIFRLACSNGAVVAAGNVGSIRVSHTGKIVERVIDGCIEVVGSMPLVGQSVREMSSLMLTQEEQLVLALSSMKLKWGEEAPIKPEQLLTVNRNQDNKNDLWTVFNRIQENTIRGGLRYIQQNANGKRVRVKTKGVNGISEDMRLNRSLWSLAEAMKMLKTGGSVDELISQVVDA